MKKFSKTAPAPPSYLVGWVLEGINDMLKGGLVTYAYTKVLTISDQQSQFTFQIVEYRLCEHSPWF